MTKELKISRLIDNNCYEEWQANVMEKCRLGGLNYDDTLYSLIKDCEENFNQFIVYSFNWSSTPEHFEYWEYISRKYLSVDPLPIYSKP